jgi:hypothetical protein
MHMVTLWSICQLCAGYLRDYFSWQDLLCCVIMKSDRGYEISKEDTSMYFNEHPVKYRIWRAQKLSFSRSETPWSG